MLSDAIVIHLLAPMLADKDVLSLSITNKYGYNILAPKIKLKNRYSYTSVIKTNFIVERISLNTKKFDKGIISKAKEVYSEYVNATILYSCKNLNTLTLTYSDEDDDILYLPTNTHTLIVGYNFESRIVLPSNLKVLKSYVSRCDYDFSFEKLPPALENLRMVENVLLSSEFPSTLHTLKIGRQWRHELTNLPINLKKLSLKSRFPINVDFPPNLEELTFDNAEHYNILANKIPIGLKSLKIKSFLGNFIDIFPPNLHTLKLGHGFEHSDPFPSSLHTLEIGNFFNAPVNNLPPNLHTLKFGNHFNQPINHLPVSLYSLQLGREFDYLINVLPPNLKKLYLHPNYKYINEIKCQFKHISIMYKNEE
jgi:hypothetical protein